MDPEQAFNYESNKHTVSSFIGLIFMSLLFGLYGLVYMMNDVLPVALVLDDEVTPFLFSLNLNKEVHL